MFRALDGTTFTEVDTQNPATEVLFNELSAQAAFDDESLLEAAYEAILFQPTDGTAAAVPPTQFKVYLTPLEVHGRWRNRCGKIDFVDAPSATPKAKAQQPRPLSAANKDPQPPALAPTPTSNADTQPVIAVTLETSASSAQIGHANIQ